MVQMSLTVYARVILKLPGKASLLNRPYFWKRLEKTMAANPQQDDLHGIYMTEEAFERLISVESPYRYELIDGVVYDMTGSTPEHSVIASNVEILVREQLDRNGPCRTHRDQYVAIPGKPPVVPDVVLTCDRADWDKDKRLKPFMIQFATQRVIIVCLLVRFF